jgi:alpha-beta hydrolase superfamily lysophospholipase
MAESKEREPAGDIRLAEEWFSTGDGVRLFLRRWTPQTDAASGQGAFPWGTFLIVHGMAEHSARYDRFAGCLCGAGIEVWVADLRGHGKTAESGINDPGKGGLLGHCGDSGGYRRIVADINGIGEYIKTLRPDLPFFLMGHSWGSFLVQAYIEAHSEANSPPLAGCILSGTRGPDGLKIAVAPPVMSLLALLRGSRTGSALARAFADGPFNKPFRPNRTMFDWLSRDEAEVDRYVADPCSGMLCSAGFYRDLAELLAAIHKKEAMDRIRRDLPIYVFSGSADPCGDMGASPTALVNRYRSLGIKDLEFVLYPDARHETLNETNREEVMGDLIAWLLKHRL